MQISTPSPKRRHRRTPEQWQELVTEFNASELSIGEFCDQRGLVQSTLKKWYKRFLDPVSTAGASFVEVSTSRSAADRPATVADDTPWQVRLALGGGIVLELSRS